MMNNEILLRRRNMLEVNLPEYILDLSIEENVLEQNKRNAAIASISKNFSSYGFMFSKELVEKLQNCKYEDIVSWYLSIKTIVYDLVGLRENMEPLYKNFPEDVMNTNEGEMYLASLVYFLSNNTISPKETKIRPELNEFKNLTPIKLADENTYYEILTNLLSSKISFGETDKKDLKYYVENVESFYRLYPESIPNKENLVSLTKFVIDKFGYEDERTLSLTSVYKTATDILRLIVVLSDGDVSLATTTKFKKFSRAERRFLLALINNVKNPLEDMARYKTHWIIVGEILHPGEYATRYPHAYEVFSKIRSNVKITKFNGKVDNAFATKNLSALLKLLNSRPGEFCNKVDRCLSTFNTLEEQNTILDAFEKVATKTETKNIIGLLQHMNDRKTSLEYRIFFPKGNISRAYYKENDMKTIDEKIVDRCIDICKNALISKYAELEPMGTVFIDEELKDFMFPMTLRNAARALKPMARGSKIKLDPNTNTVRVFMYWKEPKNNYHVDLDLSVILLDENYNLIDSCYYGNLDRPSVKAKGCYHSGDVRQAPNGASEYVDLDMDKLMKANVSYVLVCVHSFTEQPFSELDEAFVGAMERENPLDGQIFEPSTIVTKSDLITEQKTSLSMMLTVKDRSLTWLDLGADVSHADDVCNNIRRTNGNMIPMTKAFMQRHFVSIYDIIMLNAMARGVIVTNKADADYIFSLEGYVEPEIEEVLNEMTEETVVTVTEEVVSDETEIEPTENVEEEETIVEPPKHILVTPYDIDILIGNYL